MSNENKTIYQQNIYVYSWGKNKNGELGNGTIKDYNIPTPSKSLKNIIPIKISSGGKHTLLITENNEILSCGSGEFNVIGKEKDFQMKKFPNFEKINFFEKNKIIDISCGEFHSISLTKENKVYSWGGNLNNKLGQDNNIYLKPSIIKSLSLNKITQISCGEYHTIALSNNNEIFSWGGGGMYNHGQCGLGNNKINIEKPTKINWFNNNYKIPIKIICGGYHSMVLCADNHIYSFGKGDLGQLGNGKQEDCYEPKKCDFKNLNVNDIIKDISCGSEHSILLTEKGKVYVCGNNYNGQLGIGNNNNVYSFLNVNSLNNIKIIQIACGWNHSLILSDEGYVYSCGCNVSGELGIGDCEYNSRYNFSLVIEASKLNVKKIFCGGHHSWIVIDKENPIKKNFNLKTIKSFIIKDNKISYKNDNNNENFVIKKKKKLIKYDLAMKSLLRMNIDNLCNDESNIKDILIIYSNMKISSRYIIFYIKLHDFNNNMNDFKEILEKFVSKNCNIISFNLTEIKNQSLKTSIDCFDEIDKEMENNLGLMDYCPFGYKKLLISIFLKDIINLKCNLKHNLQYYTKSYNIEELDKKSDETCNWVKDFLKNFEFYLTNIKDISPKFIEFQRINN